MTGRYEIEQIAGSGAHAVVCLARVRGRGERVALKVLRPQLLADPSAVSRFTDEARLLLPIRHPDIVRVHRLLDYAGRPVIELEPVVGVSLDHVLRYRAGGLPREIVLELGRRTAEALHAAWEGPFGPGGSPMRVVHRDIKPENLLLSREGRLKVLDFGVAKAAFEGRRTRSVFSAPGSAGYSAPERRRGRHDQPSLDVYALGVTLFVLLTGRPLVLPSGSTEALQAAERQLSHLADPAVRELVRHCIAFDPNQRPTMAALAARLTAMVAAGPEVPDLAAFASASVTPILERRRGLSLAEDLDVVRFLEEEQPNDQPAALTAAEAEAAVRRVLTDRRWELRVAELEGIAAVAAGGFDAPLLEVLARGRRTWWAPWAPLTPADQLVAALWLLGDHPSTALTAHASPLVHHAEDRVRRAARFVLGQG